MERLQKRLSRYGSRNLCRRSYRGHIYLSLLSLFQNYHLYTVSVASSVRPFITSSLHSWKVGKSCVVLIDRIIQPAHHLLRAACVSAVSQAPVDAASGTYCFDGPPTVRECAVFPLAETPSDTQ